jgi:hypothetical protein
VIEASVAPDLRDPAPFEFRPFESVEFDPGPYEPGTHDSAPVGSESEAAAFEAAGFEAAGFEEDDSGISFDEAVYDRTTFDHLGRAPVDPAPVDAAPLDPVTSEPEPAPVGSDGPDPWAQFSRNMFDDVDTAADEVTPEQAFAAGPPPVPEAVPDQPDWSPELDRPFSAAAPTDREDVVLSAPAPDSPPAPDAVPAGVPSAMGGPRPAGAGGTGGLARRVPGASLAESRQPGPADASAAPVDRSADGVRSMLSSFQAGRSRGRVPPEAEAPQSPSAAPAAPPPAPTFGELDDHDISQDGRSSR